MKPWGPIPSSHGALVLILMPLGAACSQSVHVEAAEAPRRQEGDREVFDHGGLDRVLEGFVSKAGMVDPEGLTEDREALDEYVGGLAAASPESRGELFPTREHELAYWISAYNALMLRAVVDAYPVQSPRDIMVAHGVFRRLEFPVGGRSMTLDDIEKGVLLKRYDEPRVHFALTCASMSCPRIDRVAFHAGRLSAGSAFVPERQLGALGS